MSRSDSGTAEATGVSVKVERLACARCFFSYMNCAGGGRVICAIAAPYSGRFDRRMRYRPAKCNSRYFLDFPLSELPISRINACDATAHLLPKLLAATFPVPAQNEHVLCFTEKKGNLILECDNAQK